MNYESPTKTKIKDHFGDNIHVVPGGARLKDVMRSLKREWPESTLDLSNCAILPRSYDEVLLYEESRLSSDFELIIYSNEKDWNKWGNFWVITDEEFESAHSELLKDVWRPSIDKRRDFVERKINYWDGKGKNYEPRFRYDAVKRSFDDDYNVWDYMTLVKGGMKFYNEHFLGEHITLDDIDIDARSATVKVPSDRWNSEDNPMETYRTVIEYKYDDLDHKFGKGDKRKRRTLRDLDVSCSCMDYKRRKRMGINPVCKHMVYALAELACIGVEFDEMLPFPTDHGFELYKKMDWMLYPSNAKTGASMDALMRAYIDYNEKNINSFFTTNPGYVKGRHRSYVTFG